MPLFMLDTNIISYVLKRPQSQIAVRFRRTPAAHIAISSIVESELRFGVARMPKEARLGALVDESLRLLTIYPWDSSCARHCSTLRASLGSVGLPLSYADAMIAAHAIALDLPLVTKDEAFTRVKHLRIIDWGETP